METHCGVGGRKWRGVSSYQVKDDLHEWDTHACSLEWNICLVSLFVCVSLGEKNTVKGKERSLGLAQHTSVRTLLPNKVHFKVHSCKDPTGQGITAGLIEYPESIKCTVTPAMYHDY